MDDLDRRILTAIQADLPLVDRPFDALAGRMDLDPDDLLARVRRMAEGGLIRRLGPVFDSGRLGYVSTLVAARVPTDRLERVAEAVNRLSGVTHNYERRGPYNLWFTLTAGSEKALERALERLRAETGVAEMHSLPALVRYKIRATFDLVGRFNTLSPGGRGQGEEDRPVDSLHSPSPRSSPIKGERDMEQPLSHAQKALVRAVQDGLPIEAEPFAPAAEAVGWTVPAIIQQMRAWRQSGVVRRVGAVVGHRAAGVRAGAMAVFQVEASRVDAAGRRLAAEADVTHCYRRPALSDFPYTLYAMVHGESEAAVRGRVEAMAGHIRADAWDALFSVREFKKTSMRYFTEGGPG